MTDADLRNRRRPPPSPRAGIEIDPGAGAGTIATQIFERLCEDRLIQPTFVCDLPTGCRRSRQKPDDPDTVERFELYIGGFEVANAFSGTTIGRTAPGSGSSRTARGDLEAHAMDEDYIRALE